MFVRPIYTFSQGRTLTSWLQPRIFSIVSDAPAIQYDLNEWSVFYCPWGSESSSNKPTSSGHYHGWRLHNINCSPQNYEKGMCKCMTFTQLEYDFLRFSRHLFHRTHLLSNYKGIFILGCKQDVFMAPTISLPLYHNIYYLLPLCLVCLSLLRSI